MTLVAQPGVAPALTPPTPDIARPLNSAFSSGVTLLGADELPALVAPGAAVSTRLYWKADEPSQVARPFRLILGDTSAGAETQVPADLAPSAVVHTYADLLIPPDAPTGEHTLWLKDLQGGEQVALGQVRVGGRPHTFQVPAVVQPLRASFGEAVELLGIDTPSSVIAKPGQVVTITLAWTVVDSPLTDLARFVHVLGTDGRPVTQRAGAPCAGQESPQPDTACPSASWIPGEVLLDQVELVIPADLPPGRYPLATGWYDSATLKRTPARDAQGEPVPDYLLRLPVELVVAE